MLKSPQAQACFCSWRACALAFPVKNISGGEKKESIFDIRLYTSVFPPTIFAALSQHGRGQRLEEAII